MLKSETHFPQVPKDIAEKIAKARVQPARVKDAQDAAKEDDDDLDADDLIDLNSVDES